MRPLSASTPAPCSQPARIALLLLTCGCAAHLSSAATGAANGPDRLDVLQSAEEEYRSQQPKGEDWSAEVQAAEALVAEARRESDARPLVLAQMLSRLGQARLHTDDLAGAEAAFAEALELVEREEGTASGKTLSPLSGLGFTLAKGGRHVEAIPHLDRALLIAHRTHGLFNSEQLSILRQLASSLTVTGEPLVAERHVNYMLRVGEQTHGKHEPDIVPLMCSVADWHSATGNFDVARRHYREAIEIVEKKLGKNDVALVRPLRRLARSYVQQLEFVANGYMDPRDTSESTSIAPRKPRNPRYLSTEGQRALQRAVALLEANPDAPTHLTVDVLIDLGDWFQFKQETRRALRHYRAAAQRVMNHNTASAESISDPLAVPVRVYYPAPGVVIRGNRLAPFQSEEAYVQLELTVTPEGLVEQVQVTDESTSSRQATEVLNAMRDARFRPKFINGEPVETVGMTFREVVRIRKRDDDQS